MKVSTINRKLSDIEAKLYAKAVMSKELEEKEKQLSEIMRGMEEFTEKVKAMSFEEKRQVAQQIEHDSRTMSLSSELEKYRTALRNATLRNLGLYDPIYGIATLPESCKEEAR